MTASFKRITLTNSRVLVKGTDSEGTEGEVVLDSTVYDEVKAHQALTTAHSDFDAAVEDFFADLIQAQEKLDEAHVRSVVDTDAIVVLDEGEEGTAGRPRQVMHLDRDGVILRLLDRGEADRLVWVAGQLEVLAVLETPTTVDYDEMTVGVDADATPAEA